MPPTAPTEVSQSTPGTTFGAGPTASCLRSIPGASILGVQLCDAPAVAEADPLQATLHERLLPGDGELDLRALLADLREAGAVAPIGVEGSPTLHARSAPKDARRLAGASLRVLGSG